MLDGRGRARAQTLSIWVTAAALAASCAVLTTAPAYASRVHIQPRRPGAPHATRLWVPGGGRAILLGSPLAARPHPASASSPQAVPGIAAARRPIVRDLRRYLVPALVVVALLCLTGLVALRVRRRRASARQALEEARGGRGRHAVAGPAGSRDAPVGWPDFSHFAGPRRGVPDRPAARPAPGTPRSGDPAADEPASPGPAPGGHATAGRTDAEGDAPDRDVLDATLPSPGSEPGDNGIRPASGGPPWEPAGKPPGGPPWEPARKPPGDPPWAPVSPAWARDQGTARSRLSHGPDDVTDVPPPEPPGEAPS